jgi:hypothetical protein
VFSRVSWVSFDIDTKQRLLRIIPVINSQLLVLPDLPGAPISCKIPPGPGSLDLISPVSSDKQRFPPTARMDHGSEISSYRFDGRGFRYRQLASKFGLPPRAFRLGKRSPTFYSGQHAH